jgi:uncharacterized protein (DUF111 family)
LLRVSIGETIPSAGAYERDIISVLEANIDDMNPEFYDHIMSLLFEAGALDVSLTCTQMKKNRPGVRLTVLVAPECNERATDILLSETSTLGVRSYDVTRKKLAREIITVETPYGEIRVKLGKIGDEVRNVSPEYEDCRRAAVEHDAPLKVVYEAARRAAFDQMGFRDEIRCEHGVS